MNIVTIGLDLAKHVFQVHGVDVNDKVTFNKPLRRAQMLPFFAKLAPCLIGMEACASAHYWARELKKLGHDVRLMPAKDVKAHRLGAANKEGKLPGTADHSGGSADSGGVRLENKGPGNDGIRNKAM